MITLTISLEYMERESKKWNSSVFDWIKNYCKKNQITLLKKTIPSFRRMYEIEDEDAIILQFRSNNQLEWFVRQGNKKYPYFEFI